MAAAGCDHGEHRGEESAMTEQPNAPDQPGTPDDAQSERRDEDRDRHGAVRTQGETAVDDAIGTGDNVH